MPVLLRNLSGFGLIGALNAGLTWLLFSALIGLELHYLMASFACWLAGLVVSFAGNKRLSFAVASRADRRQVATFLGCYLVQLLIGLAAFALFVDVCGLSPGVAFWIVLLLTSACSFTLMKWVVFAPARIRDLPAPG